MMFRTLHAVALASICVVSTLTTASAAETVLYDGALGTAPTAQGLTYGSFPFTNFATTSGGSTTLDTSASNATYAGFGTNSVALPHGNFTLRFDMRVLSSDFANADRSGFDVLAIDSTGKGIEVGFHGNEIFSLGAPQAFARVDQTTFDTTAALTRYDLAFSDNAYTLSANGNAILTGAIRDYSSAIIPPPIPNPYASPNNLFLGDDTTSARGSTQFSYVSVTVPEPATLAAVAATLVVGRRRRRGTRI